MSEKNNEAVKAIDGRRWSKTLRAWLIPYDKKLLELLLETLNTPLQTQVPDWMDDYMR